MVTLEFVRFCLCRATVPLIFRGNAPLVNLGNTRGRRNWLKALSNPMNNSVPSHRGEGEEGKPFTVVSMPQCYYGRFARSSRLCYMERTYFCLESSPQHHLQRPSEVRSTAWDFIDQTTPSTTQKWQRLRARREGCQLQMQCTMMHRLFWRDRPPHFDSLDAA
jgi:hypothetical protein